MNPHAPLFNKWWNCSLNPKKIDDAHFYDIKVHAMNLMNLINLIRFMSDQGRDYHFARNRKSFMECALILPWHSYIVL